MPLWNCALTHFYAFNGIFQYVSSQFESLPNVMSQVFHNTLVLF